MLNLSPEDKILSVDIGGSKIKATILNPAGEVQTDYKKLLTPSPASPENVIAVIQALVQNFSEYTKVSVGFPGFVKKGCVLTAPNLNTALWQNFNLQEQLCHTLGKPVRLVNDADLQGLGVAYGKGFEMLITLGTGFGSCFLLDGSLLPHVELAHHPVYDNKTYDQFAGESALTEYGEEEWNRRMEKVLAILKTVFNYDHLFISGGNASKIRFPLAGNISIVSNRDGIKGGSRLWRQEENRFTETLQCAF